MKKIIFLFLHFVALPIIGYEVTGKEMGGVAFMVLSSLPIYLCCFKKEAFNFLIRVMH